MKQESGVITVSATIEGFESLLHQAIIEKLGDDKDALKLFQVDMYVPPDEEAAVILKKIGKRLFDVSGALGLNDGGDGWKAFNFQMEEGLSAKQDAEVADQLAHQCLICVSQMKRESKAAVAV